MRGVVWAVVAELDYTEADMACMIFDVEVLSKTKESQAGGATYC